MPTRRRKLQPAFEFDWRPERRGRRARQRETLTDPLVAALNAQPKEYAMHDYEVQGLYIRVRSSGLKSWYYRPGHKKSLGAKHLGSFPTMSVQAARNEARRAEYELSRGGRLKETSRPSALETVCDAFAAYLSHGSCFRSSEWQSRVRREFDRHFLPTIGDLYLQRMTASQAEAACACRPTYYGTRNLRDILRSFLSWAVETGRITTNVLKGNRSPPRPEPRLRQKVTPSDLGELWRACEVLPINWKWAFRLLIVSGLSMKEVLAARARTTGWSPHIEASLPRGPLVDMILDEMHPNEGDYVFRARGKTGPMTFRQDMLERLREAAFLHPFTPGDITRAARSLVTTSSEPTLSWDDIFPPLPNCEAAVEL
ncbi:Arm DNA-binding domain-containing protein [Sphingosinicella sp. LHD-64]|uniref:tyrosine-type recombinase/integrase n=1 Tax=Sphingosinicella sp. LHD-64 TaxID=3072139 RepID=UPI00280D660D|nr:Arm DNA-binding domain-containing protein [Sphingosinicella sp. LHD-64]MDQ8754730.1 Arm DNA-binding domain-containing protein [Sphingosinicella sp. LHD-64]